MARRGWDVILSRGVRPGRAALQPHGVPFAVQRYWLATVASI
jgi:hypothetical protein